LQHFVFACLALLACALVAFRARAAQPIKIVVPYTPGAGPTSCRG
jgi:hypothetical protein